MKTQSNDISTLELISKCSKLCFNTCKGKIIFSALFTVIHSLTFVLNIVTLEYFFGAISNLAIDASNYKNAIIMCFIYGGVIVLNRIVNVYSNFYCDVLSRYVHGFLYEKINIKSSKIPALAYENPLYLDSIKRANDGVESCYDVFITVVDIFAFYGVYEVFICIYLYSINPLLVLSLLFICIPSIASQFIKVKFFKELADSQGPIKREYEYYEKCMSDREYYKETRLLGAFSYFKSLYINSTKLLNIEIWKTNKKSLMADFLCDFLTLIGYISIIILSIILIIKEKINIAQFATIFGSIDLMISMFMEIVNFRISKITKKVGFAKNLINFLDIPETKGIDVNFNSKVAPEISIENLSFSYPNAKKISLNNINLKIKSGETIAIVGENGAGKSTIAKLIMGLYTPTSGKVKIDGYDTAEISPKSMYSNISAVFQNYQRYKMTLEDNIQISSILPETDSNKLIIKNEIEKAVNKADFEIDNETFINGYETMLSREFDGIDLSGGQWQRIAIARGFYKNHNMIILDEPTAAIDPVMETKIYQKFAEMSKGNTSIIVTHRLGSAKIADRIIVMDNGEIVETGSHDELLSNNGKYTDMYNAQSKWYVETVY
ncbi:MAG: ABC transporter ATP-binding protein [Oscillospiraceae bacterium]